MLKIIRRNEKLEILGLSKTTNYEKEKRGESCKAFKISERNAGYIEQHVLAEAAALSCGYNAEKMKQLVVNLEGQRKEILAGLLAKFDNLTV
jgi:predicted DNA-binding transcriptional regulator AlpA